MLTRVLSISRRRSAGVDPLGFYLPPMGLRDDAGAGYGPSRHQGPRQPEARRNYIHAHEFTTVVREGEVRHEGEWANAPDSRDPVRRNIKGNDVEQFRSTGKQVVIWPDASSPATSSTRTRGAEITA